VDYTWLPAALAVQEEVSGIVGRAGVVVVVLVVRSGFTVALEREVGGRAKGVRSPVLEGWDTNGRVGGLDSGTVVLAGSETGDGLVTRAPRYQDVEPKSIK
jgi:hypothetical protein